MALGAFFYNMSDIHSSLARFIAIAAIVFVASSIQALFLASAGNFRALTI